MTTAPTTRTTRSRSKTTPESTPPRQATADALTATVLQADLKRGLAIVSHAVATRSSLPVLSHVLLASAGPNQLRISATNLEIGIVVMVAAQVASAGAIALPAKLLADVVGGLPNGPIALAMDRRTQSVQLACGHFEATIKGIDAEEFPAIPSITDRAANARFTPEALCSAIAQVAFAASTDDTRPILTGVRLRLRDTLASFVAADSFRLAFRDITLDAPVLAAQEVVVPARALAVFGKVLADADGLAELLIDDSGDRLLVRTDEVELITRCIDGRYPDADKYLALSSSHRAGDRPQGADARRQAGHLLRRNLGERRAPEQRAERRAAGHVDDPCKWRRGGQPHQRAHHRAARAGRPGGAQRQLPGRRHRRDRHADDRHPYQQRAAAGRPQRRGR